MISLTKSVYSLSKRKDLNFIRMVCKKSETNHEQSSSIHIKYSIPMNMLSLLIILISIYFSHFDMGGAIETIVTILVFIPNKLKQLCFNDQNVEPEQAQVNRDAIQRHETEVQLSGLIAAPSPRDPRNIFGNGPPHQITQTQQQFQKIHRQVPKPSPALPAPSFSSGMSIQQNTIYPTPPPKRERQEQSSTHFNTSTNTKASPLFMQEDRTLLLSEMAECNRYLSQAERSGVRDDIAYALAKCSLANRTLQPQKAIQQGIKALQIYQSLSRNSYFEEIITVLNNLGFLYAAQQDYRKAVQKFEKALSYQRIYFSKNDQRTKSTLINLNYAKDKLFSPPTYFRGSNFNQMSSSRGKV